MSEWPRPSFVMGSNPKDEEERLEFLTLLRDFIIKMRQDGINGDGNLHEEVEGFERRYRSSMTQIIQQCVAGGLDARVLRASAETVSAALEPLVESLERMSEKVKKGERTERSEQEKIVEEIYARTLFGILSVVVFPQTKEKLVEYTTELNSTLFSRYLIALEHKCEPSEECHCADRTPIEAMIETSALIASAKTTPETLSKTFHLFYPYYKNVASPKWALACNLLYPSHCANAIEETYLIALLCSIEKLLDSGNVVHVSTIKFGPGQASGSLSSSEPSDFVMITLELCIELAKNNHKFTSDQLKLFGKLTLQDPVDLTISSLELINVLAHEPRWGDILDFDQLYKHNAKILAPSINFRRIAEIVTAAAERNQDFSMFRSTIDFLNSIASEDRKLEVLQVLNDHAGKSPILLLNWSDDFKLIGSKYPELRAICVSIDKQLMSDGKNPKNPEKARRATRSSACRVL